MDQLSNLLQHMNTIDASDLFLSADRPATYRVRGQLIPPDGPDFSPEKIDQMARLFMLDEHFVQFEKNPEINVGVSLPHIGRFRVNIFKQRHTTAMVIRAIPAKIPTMRELGLPKVLEKISMLPNGIVLVVGPTGTGKSSSLASMVKFRCEHECCHVMTLEDPIEFIHNEKSSIVNQREIGVDTQDYHQGLVNVLRQSPDVLMIGEVRDVDVLEKLLEFSDTGHLCMSTLHANNVTQAVERMISMFPEEKRDSAQVSLAGNLRAVIAQKLIPSSDGKQVLAYELHTFTAHTTDLIRRGEIGKIQEFIEKDSSDMSQTFDESLFELYKHDKITEGSAIRYAKSSANMKLKFRLDTGPNPSVVNNIPPRNPFGH